MLKIGLLIVAVSAGNSYQYDIPKGDYVLVVEADDGAFFALPVDGGKTIGNPALVATNIFLLPTPRDPWAEAGLAMARAFITR